MALRSHASASRSMPDKAIADRYELEELVGTGGMSSVYKARDQLLERHVALKVLHAHYGEDAEYVERFRHEARSVAQLSHPHIVTVIDRGEADGQQFIVFEYIDGENLKELVERAGLPPVRRAVELALQIAEALAFAHEHDLVHRDVKPQNVLLTPDGDVKVTDFGIARSLGVEHGVTQTGTVLGTSNYLSPEQASGQPVTPAPAGVRTRAAGRGGGDRRRRPRARRLEGEERVGPHRRRSRLAPGRRRVRPVRQQQGRAQLRSAERDGRGPDDLLGDRALPRRTGEAGCGRGGRRRPGRRAEDDRGDERHS